MRFFRSSRVLSKYLAMLLGCLFLAACSQSANTPAEELNEQASRYVIYGDALTANWQDWNWNINSINLTSTKPFSGTKSVYADLKAYGGFSPRYGSSAFATRDYGGISFKVFHQAGGRTLRVHAYKDDSVEAGSSLVTLTPNTWKTVTLTWAQLGNPSTIKRIAFQDASGDGAKIYLDDIVLLAGTSPVPTPSTWQLSPGINLGHGLEPPSEGAWSYDIKQSHFKAMKDAGFKSVRIPVRWSSHTLDANYTIDPKFFARVDQVIGWAHAQQLLVVLDMHHWGFEGSDYDSLFINPPAQRARFMKLWQQVAEHYKNYDNASLYFELLNEPHDGGDDPNNPKEWLNCTDTRPASQCFTDDNQYWAGFLKEGLAVIRTSGGNNATRQVILGNAQWNNALTQLNDTFGNALPANDRNLIVTVHMYEEFCFSHYGFSGNNCRTWSGTAAEKAEAIRALDITTAWAKKFNRPIYVGEWGAAQAADYTSRARYFRFVQGELTKRDLDWAFWDFASDSFGIFDVANNRFYPELLSAVFGR